MQIIDFVKQSKGWQYVERIAKDSAENIMINVLEEELYNLPTAEYVNRRGGFVVKQFTVYHVATHACAELRDKEVLHFSCVTILNSKIGAYCISALIIDVTMSLLFV
jgi:hypothetical protein